MIPSVNRTVSNADEVNATRGIEDLEQPVREQYIEEVANSFGNSIERDVPESSDTKVPASMVSESVPHIPKEAEVKPRKFYPPLLMPISFTKLILYSARLMKETSLKHILYPKVKTM